jgi:hypothetical protein
MGVFSKPSLLKTSIRLSSVALGLTAIGGGSYYAITQTEPKLLHKTQVLCNGLSRLGNLVSTVSLICIDYLKTMQLDKKLVRPSDPVREEIRITRIEHERVSILLYQTEDSEQRQILQNEINSIVTHLRELSVKLAQLIEEDPPSPFVEAHQRSAIRLHQLCEWNGGVYIKLGQHLAQLDYILPLEFVIPLRQLLGDTPRSSKDAVRRSLFDLSLESLTDPRTIFEDMGKYPEDLWTNFEWEPIASASLAQVN